MRTVSLATRAAARSAGGDVERGAKAERYAALVAPYVERPPDSANNPQYYRGSIDEFADFVGGNLEAMRARFGYPMPPTLEEDPELVDGFWASRWEPAFDLTGSALSYELQIASSPRFTPASVVLGIEGIDDAREIVEQRVDASRIPSGRHYARVIARAASDPQRYWQVSANVLRTRNGTDRYGPIAFDSP